MSGMRLSTLVRRLQRDTAPPDGHSDADLLTRFGRARDDAAFELLVWRHGAMVLGTCRRRLGNSEDAEDAFQATFLVLARKAPGVRSGASLAAWLHRVAVRVATRLARGRRAMAPLPADPPDRRGPKPAEQSEGLVALDEEINRLSERYRQAVVLYYLEGLTAADAARQLGCPTGTVESRLAAARKVLRDRLTRRGVTLPVGALAVVSGQGALAPEAIARVVRAADAFAREGAAIAAGVVSQSSVKLAQGVLAMGRTRWWLAGVVVTAMVAASTAVVWADRDAPAVAAEDPPAAKPAVLAVAPPPVAKDEAPTKDEAWPFSRQIQVPTTWRGFSPDARSLVSIADKSVIYYDLDSGLRRTVVQSQNPISDIAISPDGKRVATAEGLEGVKIWDTTTGKFLEAYWPSGGVPAQQVAFSPDGSQLIVLCLSTLKTQVWVCDLATGKELGLSTISPLDTGTHIRTTEIAAGGRYVLTCEYNYDKGVDITKFKTLFSLNNTLINMVVKPVKLNVRYLSKDYPAHINTTQDVVSPDGKGILVANGPEAQVIDPSTGRERLRLGRLKHTICAMAYSPDGKRIAAASNTLTPYEPPQPGSGTPKGPLGGVAGKAEVASPTEIVIWDAATGQELARLVDKEEVRNYRSVRFSPDGTYLVAESEVLLGPNSRSSQHTLWGRPPVMKPRRAEARPLTPANTVGAPDRFQSLIRDLSADGVADSRRVEGVFTAALGRLPTDIEARTLTGQLAAQADKAAALRNLLATLVDSAEFKAHLAALQKLAK